MTSYVKYFGSTVAEKIDVLLMLDMTGSMESWIEQSKRSCIELLDYVKTTFPQSSLRVGFIGYRDIQDGSNRFVIEPFTPNVEKVTKTISGQNAMGGGDECEDLIGALG